MLFSKSANSISICNNKIKEAIDKLMDGLRLESVSKCNHPIENFHFRGRGKESESKRNRERLRLVKSSFINQKDPEGLKGEWSLIIINHVI